MTTTIFISTHDVSFHDAHGSIATAKDVKAGENIIPFPRCLRCGTCVPTLAKWEGTALNEFDKDQYLLTKDSFFLCTKGGGTATFFDTGQEKIIIKGKPAVVTGAKIICTMAR